MESETFKIPDKLDPSKILVRPVYFLKKFLKFVGCLSELVLIVFLVLVES